jgi:glycosyltransferase involved in cell wall biosynthesis
MNITYDHEIFIISKFGGASRYFVEMISRMAEKENVDVSVFMGYFINEYGLENFKDRFVNFKGSKYNEFKRSKMFAFHLDNFLFKSFIKKSQPDIYHMTYYKYLAPSYKGKRIMTVLDMMHELMPAAFSKFDNSAEWKKEVVKKVDGIVSISHATKKDLMRIYNVPEEKIKVIHLANSMKTDVKTERIVKEDYLLYVGGRWVYKNFRMLLDVFAGSSYLKNNFKVVAYGGGKFSAEELEYMDKFGIKDKVIFDTGADEKLANYYKYASVFVYPSKYEGFGVPLLEAMYLDCPIVASNISSIPEIGGPACLYFNPDSPDDLKEKLETILTKEDVKNDLLAKAKEWRKNFSWQKTTDETYDYYKQILGK